MNVCLPEASFRNDHICNLFDSQLAAIHDRFKVLNFCDATVYEQVKIRGSRLYLDLSHLDMHFAGVDLQLYMWSAEYYHMNIGVASQIKRIEKLTASRRVAFVKRVNHDENSLEAKDCLLKSACQLPRRRSPSATLRTTVEILNNGSDLGNVLQGELYDKVCDDHVC